MPSELSSLIAGIFAAGMILAILFILIFSCIFIFFNVLTLMIGAKVAGVEGRSFGKAFIAGIIINFIWGVFGLFLFNVLLMLLGNPIAVLITLLTIPLIVIKLVYSCGFFKAFVTYIVSLLAYLTFVSAIFFVCIFTIKNSIDQNNKSSVKVTNVEKEEIKKTESTKGTTVAAKKPTVESTKTASVALSEKPKTMVPAPKQKMAINKASTTKPTNTQNNKKAGKPKNTPVDTKKKKPKNL